MVYKKYVWKNGIRHGPYYYESYREGNTVKKRYIGTSLLSRKSVVLHVLIGVLIGFLILNFVYLGITGKTVIEEIEESVEESISSAAGEVLKQNVSVAEEEVVNEETNIAGGWEEEVLGETISEEDINTSNEIAVSEEIDLNNDTIIEEETNETTENVAESNINESISVGGNDSLENETSLSNETIINQTILVNETSINETIVNASVTNETIGNVSVEVVTSYERIVIGKPVKWKKSVSLDAPDEVKIKLPKEAENVSVVKIEEGVEEEAQASVVMTGGIIFDNGKGFSFWRWILNLFSRITGMFIAEEESIEVILEDNATEYVIEYETEAPVAVEEETTIGKKVVISGPDELNYTDVLAFASIDEIFEVGEEGSIKIYWSEEKTYVEFDAYDSDLNGKLDYVEWIVPHLSNQTFEIILITKADHLDSNRTFIEEVYSLVKARDDNWSLIPAGDYLRVTFEQELDNTKDITIYARSEANAEIEVYERDGNSTLVIFENISEDGEYKVYLTLLNGTQDTFDLKVLGSDVEFDYIVDPQANDTSNVVYQCGTIDSPGVYTINQSISATGDCFNITSSNVTLDGSGKSVTGDGTGYGVILSNFNITVENMNISQFYSNMYIGSLGTDSWVHDNTFGNATYSVQLISANRTVLENNIQLKHAQRGFYISFSTSNTLIKNNTFFEQEQQVGYGTGAIVARTTVTNVTIKSNNFYGFGRGVVLYGGDNYTVEDNHFENITGGSSSYGVYLNENALSNTVRNNVFKNVSYGVYLTYSSLNRFDNNTFNDMNNYAIFLDGNGEPANNSFSNGAINGTGFVGIYFSVTPLYDTNFSNISFTNRDNADYDLKMWSSTSHKRINFEDMFIGNYSIASLDDFVIRHSGKGQIEFGSRIETCSGANFSNDVKIEDNFAEVNSENFNKEANITFYNMPGSFSDPVILKNGFVCGSDCINFTSLNDATVLINVPSWTNYSIGEFSLGAVGFCIELDRENSVYSLGQDVNMTTQSACFNITADNVTFDGKGHTLFGNFTNYAEIGNYHGISAIGLTNITIKNVSFDYFYNDYAIKLLSINNSLIKDCNIGEYAYGGDSGSFYIGSSYNNTITNNLIRYSDDIIVGSSLIENNTFIHGGSVAFGFILGGTGNIYRNNYFEDISGVFGGLYIAESNTEFINNTIDSFSSDTWIAGKNTSFVNLTTDGNLFMGYQWSAFPSYSAWNITFENLKYAYFTARGNTSEDIFVSGIKFIDSDLGNYSFGGDGIRASFKETGEGEVVFLNSIIADGTNLSDDIRIGNNSVYVDSAQTGLNKKANITLYNIGDRGFRGTEQILRGGVPCGAGCYNFTNLTASTVIFNVTSWTNYSVGGNAAPVVTLVSPEASASTTDRTPTFNWTGSDSDGDSITYEFNISLIAGGGSTCADTLARGVNLLDNNYTLPSELSCFSDNGDVYNWSVRANDSVGYGLWASQLINITALTAISMVNNSIDFGSLLPNVSVNTTDASYNPFVVENRGNSLANISVASNVLWTTEPSASKHFQFKADNYTGHEGAFYWASSLTDWRNMSTSAQTCIADLNYTAFNRSEVDILTWVPVGEHAADKSFTVTFTASLSEGT